MTKNLNIRIEENLLEEYKKYCSKHGFSISKKIRNHIVKDLKFNKKNER